jgi:hypothetical protein
MIHALVQVFAGALHSGEHGYTVAAATPTHERKQSHMDKPDPYAELSAVMQDLTAQGVPEADIIPRPKNRDSWGGAGCDWDEVVIL